MNTSPPWRYSSVQDTSSHNTLIQSGQKRSEGSFEEPQYANPSPSSVMRLSHLRLGIRDLFAGLTIGSCFLGATLAALANHIMFSHLNGTQTGNHTDQFSVSTLKNVFPAVVVTMLSIALKSSLSQVVLYHIRACSYPLGLVNLLTSSPNALNVLLILFKSLVRLAILGFVFLAAFTQGIAVTSILIPGTLTVTDTPPLIASIRIPTIDFGIVDPTTSSVINFFGMEEDHVPWFNFIASSQRWSQVITRAASNNVAPSWDAPVGCALACNYSFTYSAPALNCTELSKESIWPNGTNNAQSLLQYGLWVPDPVSGILTNFFYNSTYAFATPNGTHFEPSTLDICYLENSVSSNSTNPQGVRCEFLNATYEATTRFLNNTQASTTRIKEFTGPLIPPNLDSGLYPEFPPYLDLESIENTTFAFRSIADALARIFSGNESYNAFPGSTQVLLTPLFNVSRGQGSSAPNFALSTFLQGNLSHGLQELLGNITLAFVNEQLAFTNVSATVTPGTTQYLYNPSRLWLIYGLVFGLSLIVVACGLICLQVNGMAAVFDMEHIIQMTAESSALHTAALQPNFSMMAVKGEVVSDGYSTRLVLDKAREGSPLVDVPLRRRRRHSTSSLSVIPTALTTPPIPEGLGNDKWSTSTS